MVSVLVEARSIIKYEVGKSPTAVDVYFVARWEIDEKTQETLDHDIWVLKTSEIRQLIWDSLKALYSDEVVMKALKFFQDKAIYGRDEAALLSQLLEGK